MNEHDPAWLYEQIRLLQEEVAGLSALLDAYGKALSEIGLRNGLVEDKIRSLMKR